MCVMDVMDCWCSCMGSVSVSSCRCMFVTCVHPVAVLNGAFCMTLSLLMLFDNERGISSLKDRQYSYSSK